MKTVILQGEKINTEADFHKEISSLLGFGEYYGNNLDALWDCLNYDTERPILIIWKNSNYSKMQLNDVFDKIMSIFEIIKNQDIDSGLTEKFDFIVE